MARKKPQFGVGRNGKKFSPAQARAKGINRQRKLGATRPRTAAQQAALKRAQAKSAQKRRGTGKPRTSLRNTNPQSVANRQKNATRVTKVNPKSVGPPKKSKPAKRGATRLDRKINRVQSRGKKRAQRQGKKVINNIYTNADRSAIYTNRKGVKAYQKGVKINARTDAKVAKLKAKKKKRRR